MTAVGIIMENIKDMFHQLNYETLNDTSCYKH